jgi:hypothetical protein
VIGVMLVLGMRAGSGGRREVERRVRGDGDGRAARRIWWRRDAEPLEMMRWLFVVEKDGCDGCGEDGGRMDGGSDGVGRWKGMSGLDGCVKVYVAMGVELGMEMGTELVLLTRILISSWELEETVELWTRRPWCWKDLIG